MRDETYNIDLFDHIIKVDFDFGVNNEAVESKVDSKQVSNSLTHRALCRIRIIDLVTQLAKADLNPGLTREYALY